MTDLYSDEGNMLESRKCNDSLYKDAIRARVAMKTICDAVITTDVQGRIDYLNPAAECLTGWNNDEAIGLSLESVFHLIDKNTKVNCDYPIQLCLNESLVMQQETRYLLLNRSGKKLAIRVSGAPVYDHLQIINGAVVVFTDVTVSQELNSRLIYRSSHDALTGIYNRTEFINRLQQSSKKIAEKGGSHVVCYLDIFRLKLLNDLSGYTAGDTLLKQIARLLYDNIRMQDVLARLGGDEFGIIFSHCDLEMAHEVTKEIQEAISNFLFQWGDEFFEIAVSMGLKVIDSDNCDAVEILSHAETACYMAKQKGNNHIHISKENNKNVTLWCDELRCIQLIKKGLRFDDFQLFAQHIMPLRTGDPSMCEIFIYMKDESGSFIPPDNFIPVAEHNKIMPQIDRWVIKHTFYLLAKTERHVSENMSTIYTINLSGQSLCDDSFCDYIVEQFRSSSIQPGNICFEITETAAVDNIACATKFISTLRDIGVFFALDDFGSGLSSFGYLKNLPVDYLKIAGHFIEDVKNNSLGYAMVNTINQLGHILGLQTIAESIHENNVLEKLNSMDIDYAQGYAFHKPILLSDYIANNQK